MKNWWTWSIASDKHNSIYNLKIFQSPNGLGRYGSYAIPSEYVLYTCYIRSFTTTKIMQNGRKAPFSRTLLQVSIAHLALADVVHLQSHLTSTYIRARSGLS